MWPIAAEEGITTITDSPVLVLVINAEGRYLEADERMLATLGYTLDELRGLGVYEGVDRRAQDEWEVRLQFVAERPGSGPRTLQYILADWRAAERRLAELAPADPAQPFLHTLVAELRGRYRREASLRDDQPDGEERD